MNYSKLLQEEYYTRTLPGGLRLILQHTTSPVSYCGFAIDAGTRDEDPLTPGMAHFVEHMLFKGTRKRKAWHILNRMEKVGGNLDAFTNMEETVIYASFMHEHLHRALELMTDLVFRSTFPQAEIDKETEVIIDEIRSYEDNPAELIIDDFVGLMYPGHPLGRNILGDPAHLKTYRTRDVQAFVDRFYTTDNMIVFVQGCYRIEAVERLLIKLLEDVRTGTVHKQRVPPLPYQPQDKTVIRDTHQNHVIIGARAYDGYNPKRFALYLLDNVLGGPGMNSLLNVSLREKHGLVYTVDCSSFHYSDSGVWSVYFGCDEDDVERCRSLVLRQLDQLREEPLSTARLNAAKKQTVGQLLLNCDHFGSYAIAMGKAFARYGEHRDVDDTIRKIRALTAEDLMEVARDIFREDRLTTLIYK